MGRPETLVAASGRPDRFPTWCMGAGTFVLRHQSVHGTSRLCAHSEAAIDVETRVNDDGVESVTGADVGRYCMWAREVTKPVRRVTSARSCSTSCGGGPGVIPAIVAGGATSVMRSAS